MNKRIRLILIGCVAVAAIFWLRSDRNPGPDTKLVRHFDALCDIAKRHVDTPKRGVEKTFRYLGTNSPRMLELFGELLVEIEKIRDDDAHDERAREAARRFRKHGDRCEEPMERFWAAVERDPEASALAQRGFERFGRTLEILFGQRGGLGAYQQLLRLR